MVWGNTHSTLSNDIFTRIPDAALADIAALKQLGLKPASVTQTMDSLATNVQNGQWLQAEADLISVDPDFQILCNETSSGTTELHLLKVGSDGSSADTLVKQWQGTGNITYGRDPSNPRSYTQTASGASAVVPWRFLITNADKGALLSWAVKFESYCAAGTDLGCTSSVGETNEYHLTTFPGGDITWPAVVPGQDWYAVQPILQLQDGTYVGVATYGLTPFRPSTSVMVKFDTSGNILGYAGTGYAPQIATADGGIIASTPSGAALTFDANLNTTGRLANLPTQGWTGNSYQIGSVETAFSIPAAPATPPYWSFAAANQSANKTSPLCHDQRDQIVAEYGQATVKDSYWGLIFGRSTQSIDKWPRFTPNCFEFTNSAHSGSYSFSDISTPGSSGRQWALIKQPLVFPASSGRGLDAWLQNYRTITGNLQASRTITSGYRDPVQNQAVGGRQTASRHMFGDAIDFQNQSCVGRPPGPCLATRPGAVAEWNNMIRAAQLAGADFTEATTDVCNYACAHADWRYTDQGVYAH